MIIKGNLRKMHSLSTDGEVAYKLPLGKELVDLNPLLGKNIELKYTGNINCINCGKLIQKSYAQGYCYECFTTLPQTDVGVLHPEKDLSYIGISRDMEWSKKNSLIPHYIYLSLTDKVKVGVTRHTQVPTRWIDQGATQAIILAETPNRHIAGVIEVFLKNYFYDKTNWKSMLTQNSVPLIDLVEEKKRATSLLHPELKQYVVDNNEVLQLKFPVLRVPSTLKTLKLDTTSEISKKLTGIKGQYLIFDDDTAINIRNHGGYEVEFEEA
ncbi:uncharacterized protein DUF2797 [Balneicella halophila]|uniref:Uncharacterized protein DUF2797 n=1 Tax=Balneicella halophila TaxID=1537566 RepID=A0A7L4URH2_BALHA|nr:DUF2797 domain-containing protein [Balneicella halophila]PVX52340.1 uncharacterized protein DUF2797 [Balneicella halophila]